ncbi:MAG: hydrogenase maturation nickel metallochaperone HypA, partial [Conexibacter sp.]
ATHACGRRVRAVHVAAGHLRQVVPAALALAFELVAEGTVVEGARLELRELPARVRCRACAAETVQDGFPLACRACGNLDVQIVQGEELTVEQLEIDEAEVAHVR